MLASLELGQQLLDVLPNLGECRDERLLVHLSCKITICCKPRLASRLPQQD